MNRRRVVCAAVRCRLSGLLILGPRHWDLSMHRHFELILDSSYSEEEVRFSEEGFIDQLGEFMDRQEAWKVAEEAGQIFRRVGGDVANGGTLYSENLY